MRFASIARFAAPDTGGGQPFQGTSSGKGTGMGGQTPPGALGGSMSGRRTGETPPGATPADQVAIDFASGTLLAGRYEVRAKLGAGGMGVVYRVHDRVQREDVALKAILPSLVQSEEALAARTCFSEVLRLFNSRNRPDRLRRHYLKESLFKSNLNLPPQTKLVTFSD